MYPYKTFDIPYEVSNVIIAPQSIVNIKYCFGLVFFPYDLKKVPIYSCLLTTPHIKKIEIIHDISMFGVFRGTGMKIHYLLKLRC